MREDKDGEFWEAIAVGFVAGVVGQYISDVKNNIQSGKTGADIFKPTSSVGDYLASGAGGAIAAIPGLGFFGTTAVGAVGSVVADGLKGNIRSANDLARSAMRGAVANAAGYAVNYGMARLQVKKIGEMPRSSRKTFLQNKLYRNSHASVNINLRTFSKTSLSNSIKLVQKQLPIFRAGVYSTSASTIVALAF